jgi:hypothetical protein
MHPFDQHVPIQSHQRESTPLCVPSTTMLLIIVAVCTTPCVGGCSCNYGTIDMDAPQCVCACFQNYLQPNCLYTATDMVSMGIYLKSDIGLFDSFNMTSTLTWALSISNDTFISFVYAKRTLGNKTYARYLLRGDYAQQLNWDFYSQNAWLSRVGIESVWVEGLLSSTSGVIGVDTTQVLFTSSDKKIVITVSTVAWALGALICAAVVSCADNLFFHNTQEEVDSLKALMDEQQQQMRIMRAQQRGVHTGQVNGVRQISVMPSTNAKNPLEYSEYDYNS